MVQKSVIKFCKFTLNQNCRNSKTKFVKNQKQTVLLYHFWLKISASYSSRWAALRLTSSAHVLSLLCLERKADCKAHTDLWYFKRIFLPYFISPCAKRSLWVETEAFPWRVGEGKLWLWLSIRCAFCSCGLPLLQLRHCFNLGTLPWEQI